MELQLGRDGMYALVLRNPNNEPTDYFQSLCEKYGEVISVRLHNKLAFIRYRQISEANACIRGLTAEGFKILPANNKTDHNNDEKANFRLKKNQTLNGRVTPQNINKEFCNAPNYMKHVHQNKNDNYDDNSDKRLVLGARSDGKTHLFIGNLPSNVKKQHVSNLLKDFFINHLSDIFTTAADQPSPVIYYAIATMPISEAIRAMSCLNKLEFMGDQIMVMEVQHMYRQATAPLRPGEDVTIKIVTLEEIRNIE